MVRAGQGGRTAIQLHLGVRLLSNRRLQRMHGHDALLCAQLENHLTSPPNPRGTSALDDNK